MIRFVQSVDSTSCSVSRRFKLGIVFQFPAKTKTNSSQGAYAASQSLSPGGTHLWCRVTLAYHYSTLNETQFERKCFQSRFLVFQTKTKTKSESGHRRHHDSPKQEHQEFVSLQIASFANPAVRTELLSSTNVCRQLRHRVA